MNKTLQLNNLKTRIAMNAKISVFVICVEAIIYLLLCNLTQFITLIFFYNSLKTSDIFGILMFSWGIERD